jgi:hypothetical protein
MAVIAAWRTLLRPLAPWLTGALVAWWLAAWFLPATVCRFQALSREIERLEKVAPRPEILAARLRQARNDSSERTRLREVAARRQAGGSDPASLVAALVVPRLESRGVRLDRVSAREEGGEVLLTLAVQGGWRQILSGYAALDSLPVAWTSRRLQVRPSGPSRLAGEMVVGVPAEPRRSP